MSGYDDQQVITLLRDAVPAVPADDGGRFLSVRARARRTQARMMQATAAAAVTVMVIGGGVVAARQPSDQLDYAREGRAAAELAADRLDRLRTLRYDVAMTLDGEEAMKLTSEFDLRRRAERQQFVVGSMGFGPRGQTISRIVVGDYQYERTGDKGQWHRQPADDGNSYFKNGLRLLSDALRELRDPIEATTAEPVRGVPTMRYRSTLAPPKAAQLTNGLADAERSVDVEVWIDDDGNLRQLAFTTAATMYDDERSHPPVTLRLVLQVWDFDQPFDIAAPKDWTDEDGESTTDGREPIGSCSPDPDNDDLIRCGASSSPSLMPVPSPS